MVVAERGFIKGLVLGTLMMYLNMQVFVIERSELSKTDFAATMNLQGASDTKEIKSLAFDTQENALLLQNNITQQDDKIRSDTTIFPKIPHRIIITHKYKTLEDIPEPYLSNVKHTIQQYEDLWNEMEVWYLNDDDCQAVLEQVDLRLLKYFWKEPMGMYKSDLCRYAALYLKGGYYFDNDMQVVQPVKVAPHTTFVSPFEWGYNLRGEPRGLGLFNSFIAIAPRHPILKKTFDFAFDYYDKGRKFGAHMGTGALFQAYASLNMEEKGMVDMALTETQLTQYTYPDFPRLNGTGCCCDMVVHNATEQQVYFYSHMVGSKGKVTCGAN